MLDVLVAWLISPYTAIREMIAAGGPVVIWILLACVTMWTLTFERYWYFTRILPLESDKSLKQWQARIFMTALLPWSAAIKICPAR